MTVTPVAIVDTLKSLLESQQNSIIRLMGEGSPYLGSAGDEIRGPMQEMLRNNLRRCTELYRSIESLGGSPRRRTVQPEEQYLAYLSLKFLLPKIVDAKKLIIRRYENAMRSLDEAPQEVLDLAQRHLADHVSELEILERAAASVAVK